MASKWTKKDVEILIPLYEQYTHLYDTKNKDYFNRVKRDETYVKIADKIANNRKGTTIDDIKKKVKHLRIQYNQQKQLILKSQHIGGSSGGGSNGGEIYVPKVWWFEKLKFLDNYRIERQNSSNTNTQNLNPDSDISNFSNIDEESSEDFDNNLSDESAVKHRVKSIKTQDKYIEKLPISSPPIINIEPPSSHKYMHQMQQHPNTTEMHQLSTTINPNPLTMMTSKASAFTDFIAQQMNKLQDENIYSDLQDLLYNSVHDALKKDRNLRNHQNTTHCTTSTSQSHQNLQFRDDCSTTAISSPPPPPTSRSIHRVSFSDKVTSISSNNTPPRELHSHSFGGSSHKKRKSNDKTNSSSDSVSTHQKKFKVEMD